MAFSGIHIGYYEDAPIQTYTGEVIYGNLISSFEHALTTILTTTIPKNCTYLVVTVGADAWVEIDFGTPAAANTRRQIVKAGVPYPLSIGPQTAGQKSISYLAA